MASADLNRRERLAERVGELLDPFMVWLGLSQAFAFLTLNGCLHVGGARAVLEWVFLIVWPVFVVEYLSRMILHPSTLTFLRRNWWEIPILALPFLRILRLARVARMARTGRALGSVLRTSRSTGRAFVDRLAWLSIVHLLVVLLGVNLLCDHGGYRSFGRAFRDSWVLATAGQALNERSGLAQLMDVVGTSWAVVVFAAMAGTVGAYLLGRQQEEKERGEPLDS